MLLAHKPSDSYLTFDLHPAEVLVQWDIALRDLEFVIGLDRNEDGRITWEELSARRTEVEAYALARLKVTDAANVLKPTIEDLLVADHSDGAYAVLSLKYETQRPSNSLLVEYSLLFETDPTHRGLYQVRRGNSTSTGLFSPTHPQLSLDLGGLTPMGDTSAFGHFVYEGVWHIWTGFDHILFLLALLLPSVLRRKDGHWLPSDSLRASFIKILRVVTSFTVAHSITLTLAAIGWVHLPSRLIESTIAFSVIIAAVNNIRPFFTERGWIVAFAFGLIHGFGFASVLQDLELPASLLARSLLGFNLGVELGQLAILLAFVPAAFALRASMFYRGALVHAGSCLIGGIATVWLIERAFNLRILPF